MEEKILDRAKKHIAEKYLLLMELGSFQAGVMEIVTASNALAV